MALLQISNLSFSYTTSPEPLFTSLSFSFDYGWTGVVGANGSGKTTLLRLAIGELSPNAGAVNGPDNRIYCDQRVETTPNRFDDFLNSWDERAVELIRLLQIEYEWLFRWSTLSFGERKRAQIATALWRAPEVLAVDEPTNHLDADSRSLTGDALARWDGIGLVVSHDRELLDRLCSRTLFLAGGRTVMRPGGVSHGLAEEERERLEAERARGKALREERRLKREAQRRSEVESRAAKRLSKRNVGRHDGDAKSKIDLARISGKDRRGSDAARNMRERANDAAGKRQALQRTPATFVSADRAVVIEASVVRGDTLAAVDAGVIAAGPADRNATRFELEVPALVIRPADRIAVCGPNGAGKSTVLDTIASRLHAAGREFFFMRQELSAAELRSVRESLDALDDDERGRVLAIVARLGSAPERVLDTTEPSPGEARKLALAIASLRSPQALLLDEPTNHLDLPSILSLEQTLGEYNGCLIVASHDRRFVGRIARRTWLLGECNREGDRHRGRLREELSAQ